MPNSSGRTLPYQRVGSTAGADGGHHRLRPPDRPGARPSAAPAAPRAAPPRRPGRRSTSSGGPACAPGRRRRGRPRGGVHRAPGWPRRSTGTPALRAGRNPTSGRRAVAGLRPTALTRDATNTLATGSVSRSASTSSRSLSSSTRDADVRSITGLAYANASRLGGIGPAVLTAVRRRRGTPFRRTRRDHHQRGPRLRRARAASRRRPACRCAAPRRQRAVAQVGRQLPVHAGVPGERHAVVAAARRRAGARSGTGLRMRSAPRRTAWRRRARPGSAGPAAAATCPTLTGVPPFSGQNAHGALYHGVGPGHERRLGVRPARVGPPAGPVPRPGRVAALHAQVDRVGVLLLRVDLGLLVTSHQDRGSPSRT